MRAAVKKETTLLERRAAVCPSRRAEAERPVVGPPNLIRWRSSRQKPPPFSTSNQCLVHIPNSKKVWKQSIWSSGFSILHRHGRSVWSFRIIASIALPVLIHPIFEAESRCWNWDHLVAGTGRGCMVWEPTSRPGKAAGTPIHCRPSNFRISGADLLSRGRILMPSSLQILMCPNLSPPTRVWLNTPVCSLLLY